MNVPAIVPAPRWKNLPPERETDKHRLLVLWASLLGIAFAALAPGTVYLLYRMAHTDARYRIEELRQEQQRLVEEERRLTVERSTLEALDDVDRHAATKLGLVRPRRQHIVGVRDAPGDDRSAGTADRAR